VNLSCSDAAWRLSEIFHPIHSTSYLISIWYKALHQLSEGRGFHGVGRIQTAPTDLQSETDIPSNPQPDLPVGQAGNPLTRTDPVGEVRVTSVFDSPTLSKYYLCKYFYNPTVRILYSVSRLEVLRAPCPSIQSTTLCLGIYYKRNN